MKNIPDKKIFLELIEKEMLDLPQVDFPVENIFMPGIYIRQMTAIKGSFAIGHEHKTEHTNIILKGKMVVHDGKNSYEIEAPAIFKGHPGRKAAYFIEDTVWLNIHVTGETDLNKLEKQFINKSETWLSNKGAKNGVGSNSGGNSIIDNE